MALAQFYLLGQDAEEALCASASGSAIPFVESFQQIAHRLRRGRSVAKKRMRRQYTVRLAQAFRTSARLVVSIEVSLRRQRRRIRTAGISGRSVERPVGRPRSSSSLGALHRPLRLRGARPKGRCHGKLNGVVTLSRSTRQEDRSSDWAAVVRQGLQTLDIPQRAETPYFSKSPSGLSLQPSLHPVGRV